jgi:pyridoxal phosphate enzyme (YggS family)
MSDIAQNIISLKQQLPQSVRIVAVSKTKPVNEILEACSAGHRIFGENRVQEMLTKKDQLPDDLEWHFIGHLQTNKVKLIVPFISLIHSVDSFKLLKMINSEAQKINKKIDCLLQFHIAKEETKYGFSIEEAEEMMESAEISQLTAVRVCGVMGMATFTENTSQVREEFRNLVRYFKIMKNSYFINNTSFTEISAGMSGDYRIAIEEGSTIVRLGSIIFGERI